MPLLWLAMMMIMMTVEALGPLSPLSCTHSSSALSQSRSGEREITNSGQPGCGAAVKGADSVEHGEPGPPGWSSCKNWFRQEQGLDRFCEPLTVLSALHPSPARRVDFTNQNDCGLRYGVSFSTSECIVMYDSLCMRT